MAGKKRAAPTSGGTRRTTRSSAKAAASQNDSWKDPGPWDASPRWAPSKKDAAAVPEVYREMLVNVRAELAAQERDQDTGVQERPAKRRRPGQGRPTGVQLSKDSVATASDRFAHSDDDGDKDSLFEDMPTPTLQTMLKDSGDEDDDGIDFEDVAIQPAASSVATSTRAGEGPSSTGGLNLDLSAHLANMTPRRADRRKPMSKEEKARRVEVHKLHVLCLLAHVEIRNRWCNDLEVQDALRSFLPQKTVSALIPRVSLNQFGRAESLKRGLQEAKELFKRKFAITERGLRWALWAEDEEQLKNYELPEDMESTLEKSDFIDAATTLRGSRDVGAQLFCALLRTVGVEARLVCSLQPLAFAPGAPSMPKQRRIATPKKTPSKGEIYATAVAKHETKFPESRASATTPTPRRRLGHPQAAAYHPPAVAAPSRSLPERTSQTTKEIRGESPFPVYWVEVLDVAHQKWHPVDPLVTSTQYRPQSLEPPALDTKNSMAYVLAFAADQSARDVTRRYAKAYTSKTRKSRIDHPSTTPTLPPGQPSNPRWYSLALSRYTTPLPTPLDQIELAELAATEAREPMPRNVADFKDHPVYALERHLRRHEVLVPGAQASGTVSAGARAPLERIYRRSDVRVARTRDKWYRMGRVVKPGEEAVRSLPKRRRRGGSEGDGCDDDDDDDPDRVGLFGDAARGYSPLYIEPQTELYKAPPVVAGRVPRNRFGNLDLYTPSMVPPGGVHMAHARAAQAAFILGVDYAPALTGFEFRGKHGTAVLNGVVVPEEAAEGVWAVIEGLVDMDAEEEQERRTRRALRMWSRLLKGLRIRERIWAGVDEEAEAEEEGAREEKEAGLGREEKPEGKAELYEAESEEDVGGGGFFVPDIDEEEDGDDGDGGEAKPQAPPPHPTRPRPTRPRPVNWPDHIPYITKPAYSPYLTPTHLSALRIRPNDPSDPLPVIPRDLKTGPYPSVQIVPITDPNHPACSQAGLFATRDLAPGELILPYLGEVHIGTPPFGIPPPSPSPPPSPTPATTKDMDDPTSSTTTTTTDGNEEDNDKSDGKDTGNDDPPPTPYDYAKSDYDLWLSRPADLAVDAARCGNEARFVNDYRGVPGRQGKKANAEFRVVWDPRRGKGAQDGEMGMAVYVFPAGKRAVGRARVVGVARGEEVLVSYGRGFWQGRREENQEGGTGEGAQGWEGEA
ncbi:hypothetical protein C8A05DRAFT_44265 [Staphylotrichum tortipilum]|uniref:SET domain-containing protein n=1 Tax=Staphylotrichum tortipilum TaxID=2831512 RepID=A0AAN6ML85_9PEZI|nr:hypothetical protein C8A05DRAFT_44265 [Staphylotrichum longicolle]